MSFQTLKSIRENSNAGQGTQRDAKSSFPALLENSKRHLAAVLPRHLNAERMTRIALTAFRKNPSLASCEPMSVLAAVVQAVQLGLEIGLLGEAHLVPYKTYNGYECQMIPGYSGLLKLVRQSGFVADIYAHEVRSGDFFKMKLGMSRTLEHEPLGGQGGFPLSEEERGLVVGFYAVAVFKDGTSTFEPMSVSAVNKIRDESKGYQAAKRYQKDTPWDTNYVEMGIKTVLRRLCKFLPKSPEMALALAMDQAASAGIPQNIELERAADGTYEPSLYEEQDAQSNPAPERATPKPAPAPQKAAQSQAQPHAEQRQPGASQKASTDRATASPHPLHAREQGDPQATPAAVAPTTEQPQAARAPAPKPEAAKPTLVASNVPVTEEAPAIKSPALAAVLRSMASAKSKGELNEVYIRAESELQGDEFDSLDHEYNIHNDRLIKSGVLF